MFALRPPAMQAAMACKMGCLNQRDALHLMAVTAACVPAEVWTVHALNVKV